MRRETGTRIANVLGAPVVVVVVKVRFNALRHCARAVVHARGLAVGQDFSNCNITNTTMRERRAADRITSAEVDGVL